MSEFWHKTSEELPPESIYCVVTFGGFPEIAFYFNGVWTYEWTQNTRPPDYWALIPEIPDETE